MDKVFVAQSDLAFWINKYRVITHEHQVQVKVQKGFLGLQHDIVTVDAIKLPFNNDPVVYVTSTHNDNRVFIQREGDTIPMSMRYERWVHHLRVRLGDDEARKQIQDMRTQIEQSLASASSS